MLHCRVQFFLLVSPTEHFVFLAFLSFFCFFTSYISPPRLQDSLAALECLVLGEVGGLGREAGQQAFSPEWTPSDELEEQEEEELEDQEEGEEREDWVYSSDRETVGSRGSQEEAELTDYENSPVVEGEEGGEERQCWVCFASEEDDPVAAWVHPCICKGTTKWVHQVCGN